ncbi:hypothetical protein ENUP19_0248G0039 [Entamoeba nuttalli]|uniref:Methyltransferase domain containing protein n=2 Tax=Entamoeba nuttalli TaxID=412467 RepID=K2GQ40_ENTNP|nr:methyltransferase domain containing protein [Entamoeba nuttalli P19]EKE37033.1 methyltransferase domain containing protein [Entamoeba nuttalli P19]|eukprot:XP_008860630.1 methyltransferase domain containing protein [Entamoeba nuttalli P19]
MSYEGEGMSNLFYINDYKIIDKEVHRKNENYMVHIKTLSPDYRNIDDCIGRMLWEGEEILGNFMCNEFVEGKRILEVGAGVGYASFCCKGAKEIVISDYLDDILQLEQDNIELNKDVIPNVQSIKLDWFNVDLLSEKYDYIIGSEIFYTKELVDPLMKTISFLLKKNGKCLIVNNVLRYLNCEKEYYDAIQKYQLKAELIPLSEGNVCCTYNKFIITLN